MPYADPTVQRAYQRAWVAYARERFFADKSCEFCDVKTDLQLHHRNPRTKISHAVWSWEAKRREAELAKCIVLCRTCHRNFHLQVRKIKAEWRNPCGTSASYKRGCRCEKCRRANAERQVELKRQSREAESSCTGEETSA